jgi:RHS repeat-associated protein
VLNTPPPTTTVISYAYDGLYRLTRAAHSSGELFEYAYDAVGNRTAYTRTLGAQVVTTYTYDAANRLTSVNGQAYTWDNNGNLLSDGEKNYIYDQANRLTGITADDLTWSATYNGDGARLREVTNGVPTTYTLDLNAGLVQVLAQQDPSGTTTYLYGVTRIGEQQPDGWVYHLSDALGSVRQLADSSAQVTLARGYMPYGEMLWSVGSGGSEYGFTGEDWNTVTQLVFLRARYMQPELGMFLSHDPWSGDVQWPGATNGWNYAQGNPVRYTDPTGYISQKEEGAADNIRAILQSTYNVVIPRDYGVDTTGYGCPTWSTGAWRNVQELRLTQIAIDDMNTTMRGGFVRAMNGPVTIVRRGWTSYEFPVVGPIRSFAPPLGEILGDVDLPDYTFSSTDAYAKFTVVHELGHVWDRRTGLQESARMSQFIGTQRCGPDGAGGTTCWFDITAGREPPPGFTIVQNLDDWKKEYAAGSELEDWAEAVASVVYPDYYGVAYQALGPLRRLYVEVQIHAIP